MLSIHVKINKVLIEPMLKSRQVERNLVKFRKLIYRLMAQPIRFENVELSTRSFTFTDHNGYQKTAKLEGRITTRIEKFANKSRVLVFTNIDSNYDKPYKRTILC